MDKEKSKSPKRVKPNLRSSKSQEKQDTGTKKRKNSGTKDETKIAKTQTKQSLEAQCFICASPYNLNRKLPVIACQNKHTFCLNCITLSIQASKPNCPTCRTIMEPSELNSTLYHQVLQIYKQKNEHLEEKLIKKSYIKLSTKKFSKKYSNFDDYEAVPRANKFIKIKKNKEPSLLVLQPEIKDKSTCTFSLLYHPANKVQISFGVCIFDKFLLKLVQNCGFDTKIIDFFMKKDNQIIKTNTKQGMRIIVNVNLQKYELHWFQQRQSSKKGEKQLHLISSQQIEINQKVGDLAYYPIAYFTPWAIPFN